MFRNRNKPAKGKAPEPKSSKSDELLEIASQMFAELDIHRVLSMAIDRAIQAAGAERGMIVVFDDGGDISFEVARNLNREDIETPAFEVSRTILKQVQQTGEAVCLRNALDTPEFAITESMVRLQILSVIAIPLAVDTAVFGTLYLDNRSIEGAFEKDAMTFVRSLGEIISLAAFSTLRHRQLQNKVEALESKLRDQYRFDAIIGNHPRMLEVLKAVSRVAPTDATVLVRGESGTGKELIARALFQNSNRKSQEFVPINCGAIPENLLESELFGHLKGSFTGATRDHVGWFERANNGTIFLDEISEMPPQLQVKLLRVLQTGEYYPVGSTTMRTCDVRVIAASNRNLKERIKKGFVPGRSLFPAERG